MCGLLQKALYVGTIAKGFLCRSRCVCVRGLLLHLWNKDKFAEISEVCGSLVDIDFVSVNFLDSRWVRLLAL